jgi:UPF0755 protein
LVRLIRCFSWFTLLALAAGVLWTAKQGFDFWLFLKTPGSPSTATPTLFIRPGMTAPAIARLLARAGVVADSRRFYWLCLLGGADKQLQSGEYALPTLLTPIQVLDRLRRGDVVQHRVTFPEGCTMYTVAKLLDEAGLGKEEEILRLSTDTGFIRALDLSAPSLEGYLFPDTYHFQRTQDGQAILRSMVKHFRLRFPGDGEARARAFGLSVHQMVTLASLVEKEAQADDERPLIAGVFMNRLARGMLLQSDPTAVYDLPGFSGRITAAHLLRPSAYNTYLNAGLPPGPICNPGSKSLQAALHPADIPYLYFVSKGDGTHAFSRSLAEHHAAVRQYLQAMKADAPKQPTVAQGDQPSAPVWSSTGAASAGEMD